VLIERRELQSLHAEKSRLFSRIDEENALSRQLQSDVREREELLAAVRVELAQVREVAARQEQLRCEERDRASAEAAAAKERANAANEARALNRVLGPPPARKWQVQ
jgi:predicted  nucleic acid-binding Zn-ribbon protein